MGRKVNISKKNIATIVISITCIIIFVSVLFSVPSMTINRNHEQANVVLFSKGDDTSLITSLNIDTEAINLTVITEDNINTDYNENLLIGTDVIIIDRFMPSLASHLTLLREYINGTKDNHGLIFFGAINDDNDALDDFTPNQILNITDLLPANLGTDFQNSTRDTASEDYKIQIAMNTDIESQILTDKPNANILVRDIAWTSSPLISKRMLIESSSIKATATKIIESIDEDYSILSEWTISGGGGTVVLFSILINEYNDPFVLWPYFNYLMYASVFHTNADFPEDKIESFAEWPYSPIPHLIEIIMWFSMIGVLWVITFYWFLKYRRKGIQDRDLESKPTQKESTET